MRGRLARRLGAACAIALAIAGAARAESWPSRAVTLVVPFPAGSTTDLAGRIAANELGKRLGQQVVVDNRGGAGGLVGAEYVAHAAPDGYTILMGTISSHGIIPNMYKPMPYDAIADFTPIAQFGAPASILVVHPLVPARSVAELVAYAKGHPGMLNYGSTGNGTTAHLAGALFGVQTGTKVVHVPYRGGAQAMTDLLRGELSFMFYQYLPLLPHVADGKLRALAASSAARIGALPDLPTMIEAGYPDFEVTAWLALYGPARLAPDMVAKLNAAVRDTMAAPAVRDSLAAQGIAPTTGSPEALAALTRSEIARWGKVVAESGATID